MKGNEIWKIGHEERQAKAVLAAKAPEALAKIKVLRQEQMSTEEGRMKQSSAQKATHARKRAQGYVHAPALGYRFSPEACEKRSQDMKRIWAERKAKSMTP